MPIQNVAGTITQTPEQGAALAANTGVHQSIQFAIGGTLDQTKQIQFNPDAQATNSTVTIAAGANSGNITLTLPTTSGTLITTAGSGMINPMTTLGDMIYEDGTPGPNRVAGNTSATKNFLTQTGTGSVSAAPAWGTIAVGDVPTLNQNTTGTASNVTGTVAIANGGTGATTAAVAKTNLGVNPGFMNVKVLTTSGTYTPTTGTKAIRIRLAGGGGGGAGGSAVAGHSDAGSGVNGVDSTFGSTLLIAGGGQGGTVESAGGPPLGGAGGSASTSGVLQVAAFTGGYGGSAQDSNATGTALLGGNGGSNPFGGAPSFQNNAAGPAGAAGTGAGGAGGGYGSGTDMYPGPGAGSGGYAEAWINSSIAGSYAVVIGTGGAGGTAGSGTSFVGGAGGSGICIIEEFG